MVLFVRTLKKQCGFFSLAAVQTRFRCSLLQVRRVMEFVTIEWLLEEKYRHSLMKTIYYIHKHSFYRQKKYQLMFTFNLCLLFRSLFFPGLSNSSATMTICILSNKHMLVFSNIQKCWKKWSTTFWLSKYILVSSYKDSTFVWRRISQWCY